uniref:Uncharacterized protein n=1 Tax=Romanomermis culicivorax TaxID=13658 RepID=A0A915HTE7_ROMCU
MTVAQTLVAIAQQQPVATAKLPPTVTNVFLEPLRIINDDISIIEASHKSLDNWQLHALPNGSLGVNSSMHNQPH